MASGAWFRECPTTALTPPRGEEEGGMAMFAGEYLCKLDEKGRFLVPSPIREQIDQDGAGVVFLKGPEESLLLYSTNE